MTMQKPIFGAINGAANEVIKKSGCGACAHAGDSEGLAAIMLNFIEHPEEYADCGERAAEYFLKEFTFDTYMDRLEKEIENTLKNYESEETNKCACALYRKG